MEENKNSYHNTNDNSGTVLFRSEEKARAQEQLILNYLKQRPMQKFTPWEIKDSIFSKFDDSIITSVRRALCNLVHAKELMDTRGTKEKRMERKGQSNFMWYYQPVDDNGQTGLF